jgi:hypothetical protein
MGSDIRIATWNANGITQKQAELQVFLNYKKLTYALYLKLT